MSLDPRFICSSDLEGIFRDKLTGLPLAAGTIEFYSDESRGIPKAVYQLTGSPSYGPSSFTALPNPITLNAIGSYSSNGSDDIVIYYLPFKQTTNGDISTTGTDQELYYVVVKDSNGVEQFTRGAWPPSATSAGTTNLPEGYTNYIPNGQFLSHNDNPITDSTTQAGIDILEIAQGGWSFKKSTAGTGVYTISFNQEDNSPSGTLLDFPPFSVNVETSFIGTETIRDLVIQWPNVNIFSGLTSNVVNLFFAGKSNTASSVILNIRMIQNFGTGGSTNIDSSVASVEIGPDGSGYQYFNNNITVPSTSAKTTGPGNFFAIALRLPPSSPIDIRLTDFALTIGADNLSRFPITTNAEQLSESVAGWMPTPAADGSDLYLPLVLTNKGMIFDNSMIGQIVGKTQITSSANEFLLDGTTKVSSAYNTTTGIPHRRLLNFLLDNSPAGVIGGVQWDAGIIPMYGTGDNLVTLYNVTAALTTQFVVQINTPSAGGSATGAGAITIAATSPNIYYTATVNTVPTASYFWQFVDGDVNNTYNVWYTVDGVGTAPAVPSGANIKVELVTSDTVVTTIAKTLAAVNQYQYALLDARGQFLRGLGGVDPDAATRTISGIKFNGTSYTGAILSSSQTDEFKSHVHSIAAVDGLGTTIAAAADGPAGADISTKGTGGNETRPVNIALNWFIKY
jgi:hypothetical protein